MFSSGVCDTSACIHGIFIPILHYIRCCVCGIKLQMDPSSTVPESVDQFFIWEMFDERLFDMHTVDKVAV